MPSSTPAADRCEGGWFLIDGDVEYLGDAVWMPVGEVDSSPSLVRQATIVAGEPRDQIGNVVQLAAAAELDEARQTTVRQFWTFPISFVLSVLIVLALELSGVPWRTSFGRQLLIALALSIPAAAMCIGGLWLATRDPNGRVVRVMGGPRIREQYERQRAVLGDRS